MSLKNRLRFSIVALVVTVVVALSVLHVHSVIGSRFKDAFELASIGAMQIESFILQIVDEQTAERDPPPRNLEEVKQIWAEIVAQDSGLELLIQKLSGTSPVIVEIFVTDASDRILSASIPSRRGKWVEPGPSFEEFTSKPLWEKLQEILTASRDYHIVKPLGVRGEEEAVFTVHVVLSSVLLRAEIAPSLRNLVFVSGLSLLLSMLLAVVASKIAFRPLTRIGEIIDRISRGERPHEKGQNEPSEVAVVETKLSMLGKQFQGAQADRARLQADINRVLEKLEEAVLLFGPDDRLVMAGRAAERLLGRRWELLGATVNDVFPSSSDLGALIQSAIHLNRTVTDRLIAYEQPERAPTQLLVSVEIIEDFISHQRRGTMVTLRDASPRHQIESQLDIASRLASISQLTSGAAHEIKNPLNSIALHLEVLKAKLDGAAPEAESEMEVISREITRLDRVVKSFLDFTRPVSPKIEQVNLVQIVQNVETLVRPDANRQKVKIALKISVNEARIQGDRDLLTQALLNVVVNGIDAMPDGGLLEFALEESSGDWQVLVRDYGVGIPAELRDKIYDLYFTTKGKGSGIGLAMTFRVIQLHSGTIDFTSQPGQGAEFRLRFPAVAGEGFDTPRDSAQPLSTSTQKTS